jgi:AcrR family transcriptional regulator
MNKAPGVAPTGRRNPVESASRERLLAAALELFTTRGYAATSVREIVERAQLTKPTLYYHFKSKQDLYLALLEQATRDFETVVAAARTGSGTPWSRVRKLCLELQNFYEQRLPLVRLAYAMFYGPPQGAPDFDFERLHQTLEQVLLELLAEAETEGQIGRGVGEDAALAVVGIADIIRDLALVHPERELGGKALSRLLNLLYKGIQRPKRTRSRGPT